MRKAIIEDKYDINFYKGSNLMVFDFNKYGLSLTSKYAYGYTYRQALESFKSEIMGKLLEIKPKAHYAYDGTIELLDILNEFDDYALVRVHNKVLKLVKVYQTNDGNAYINLYRHRYHLSDFMRV